MTIIKVNANIDDRLLELRADVKLIGRGVKTNDKNTAQQGIDSIRTTLRILEMELDSMIE